MPSGKNHPAEKIRLPEESLSDRLSPLDLRRQHIQRRYRPGFSPGYLVQQPGPDTKAATQWVYQVVTVIVARGKGTVKEEPGNPLTCRVGVCPHRRYQVAFAYQLSANSEDKPCGGGLPPPYRCIFMRTTFYSLKYSRTCPGRRSRRYSSGSTGTDWCRDRRQR